MSLLRNFDVRAWLDDKRIAYRETGKNISHGWIGLACPWCDDPSNHLGIHLETKVLKCWRCPIKGTALKLVMLIESCHIRQAYVLVGRYQDPSLPKSFRRPKFKPVQTIELPQGSSKDFPNMHKQYLESRGFSPADQYITRYDLYSIYIGTDWSFRIVIPIYIEHRMVSYVGRDITGLAEQEYLNCPKSESIIPVKNTLYNTDTVRDTVLIVEGPTDVWRIGDGTVCTFGTMWTKPQVALLNRLNRIKSAYVMFDPEKEAMNQAHRLALALTSFVRRVQVVELDGGDPADMSLSEVQALRREIFGS